MIRLLLALSLLSACAPARPRGAPGPAPDGGGAPPAPDGGAAEGHRLPPPAPGAEPRASGPACAYGAGYYCSGGALWYCSAASWQYVQACAGGCVANPPGYDDHCAVSGQAAVDLARLYKGTPYNHPWDRSCGGWSCDGTIDCSQLVALIYPSELLPGPYASVWNQGAAGAYIGGAYAAGPGDLVFFDEWGYGYATHVGIADGAGNLIHASGYWGEVVETPISWILRYSSWARRAP